MARKYNRKVPNVMGGVIPLELENKCGVYSISSTISKHCYVGATTNFKNRFRAHASAFNTSTHTNYALQQYVKKHGAHTLVFKILEVCDVWDIWKQEIFYYNLLKPSLNGNAPQADKPRVSKKYLEKLRQELLVECQPEFVDW